MNEIRNILLVARTGSGKSSLANCLVNGDEEFKEIFEESMDGDSKTKKSQNETFEWKGIKYRVVDTIGLGDTKLPEKEVLYNIAETIGMMKEGISHVLFIINGRFTPEERKNFGLLKDAMFESRVTPYTTIIRTNFDSFQSKKACERCKQALFNESENIAEIIRTCNGFIPIDNPSLNIEVDSDDDEEKNKGDILLRKEKKVKSRERILDFLKDNYKGNYKLNSWDKIYLRINNYLNKKDKNENPLALQKEKEIIIKETAIIIQKEIPSVAKQQEAKKSSWWCNIL